jgi:predicted RND superfamily exporter protein
MQKKFIDLIVNYPKLCALVAVFTSLLLGALGFNFKSSYSIRIWFDQDHPSTQNLNLFEKRYGNDDSILFAIENNEKSLTDNFIQAIAHTTDRAWQVSNVIRVDSLVNYQAISANDNSIEIKPLLNPTLADNLDQLTQSIQSNASDIYDYLLSNDEKMALVHAKLKPAFNSEHSFSEIQAQSVAICDEIEKKFSLKCTLLGSVPMTDAFREISSRDSKTIIPLMAFVIFLTLLFFLRSFMQASIIILVAILTVISTFGILGLCDITYNNIISAMPGVLLAVCIADGLHIFTTFNSLFFSKGADESLEYSLSKNFIPTILTSVTTAIGFATLTSSELLPIRDLAILCASGTMIAWLYTYFLAGLVKFTSIPKVQSPLHAKLTVLNSHKLSSLIFKNKFIIFFTFIFIFILTTYIGLQNTINSNLIDYFRDDTKIKIDYIAAKNHLNALRTIDFELDALEPDGIYSPKFLQSAELLIQDIEKLAYVSKVISPLHIIKNMNMYMLGGDKNHYKLPMERDQVSNLLFLFGISSPPGKGLENFITVDHRFIKLTILWSVENTSEIVEKSIAIEQMAKPYNVKLNKTGKQAIFMSMNHLVVETFIKSIASAIVLVFIVMFLAFRDLKIALISMAPNIIPLTLGTAYMTLTNKPLDIGTAMVCSVCLGIAVDDTIHFLANFKIFNQNMSVKESMFKTFESCGSALIYTTVVLVLGFGSFIFGQFIPNNNFGMLVIIVLSFALITDLLFLPACLSIFIKDKKASKTTLNSL